MYQVLIKVPCTVCDIDGKVIEQHSCPNEIFAQACAIDSRVGEFHISNDEFTMFGYNKSNNQIPLLRNAFPADVIVETNYFDETVG